VRNRGEIADIELGLRIAEAEFSRLNN